MNITSNSNSSIMFSNYNSALTIAIESEKTKNEEFDTLKEALTIKIKTKMEEECKHIQRNSKLKDYSPIKHYNEMTELRHQFDKINTDLETEMDGIKTILHDSLLKLINPKPVVTELYKIIGGSSGWICRVWFTLVPIKEFECVPGDPIRVEWLNIQNQSRMDDKTSCISGQNSRNGKGQDGLQMPQFSSNGVVTSNSCLYNYANWGQGSQQQNWWNEWVQANRPI